MSLILLFLALLGSSGNAVRIDKNTPAPSFLTIFSPIGPNLPLADLGKVKLEVFTTFDCKDCTSFGLNTLPELVKSYSNNPQVDFHLYLIPDKNRESELSAVRGAQCATRYDRFWDMVNELYKTDNLDKRAVDLDGQGLKFPVKEFRACIGSTDYDAQIDQDLAYAASRKISQKPTILVNDTVLLGNQPIENIDYAIQKLIPQPVTQ